jgi:uncharacterized protein (TIGR03435 family)
MQRYASRVGSAALPWKGLTRACVEEVDGKSLPSLYVALQEQFGLKLTARKALADVLVVDHVERPSEN